MAMILRPELEGRIQQKLDAGEYESVDQLLGSALDSLDDANCGMTLAEFQAKIDEGWDAAERGDVMTPSEARLGLARLKAERLRA